jgi:hypothetical protein
MADAVGIDGPPWAITVHAVDAERWDGIDFGDFLVIV